MLKFTLNIFYASKNENTQFNVKVNFESSATQNDQSQRGILGLVLDYVPFVIILYESSFFQTCSDWFIQLF